MSTSTGGGNRYIERFSLLCRIAARLFVELCALAKMHKTGARYYLTVTDGASGRFIVSNGYTSLRRATKDYIKVCYLIENNVYDFDFWASIVD